MVAGQRRRPHRPELALHQFPEVAQSHAREGRRVTRSVWCPPVDGPGAGSLGDMSELLATVPVDVADEVLATTGIGSPLAWQVVSLLALLSALVVLVRWWLHQRRR